MAKADRRARKRENKLQGRSQREAEVKRAKQRSGLIRGAVVVVVIAIAFGVILITGRKNPKKAATTTTVNPYPAGCVSTKPAANKPVTYKTAPALTIDPAKTYTAVMSTTCGNITIALDPKDAPKTVNSFVFLAQHHFYDGLTFQRVAKDFVVQGGDPTGTGSGGPGYALPTEAPKKAYIGGDVAMANAGPNTTGSQFFLTWTDEGAQNLGGPPYLYSILGHVTKGLDVVKRLGGLYNPDQVASDPSTQKTKLPLYIFNVTISVS